MPINGEYLLSGAATAHQAALSGLADIGVQVDGSACVGIPVLIDILKNLNVDVCIGTKAVMRPVKGQVGLDGVMEAYAGGELLLWKVDKTWPILGSPLPCGRTSCN